jgi:hypothetical protein
MLKNYNLQLQFMFINFEKKHKDYKFKHLITINL